MSSASDAPLFSVVIPTYGRPRYLTEAIDSVLAQTVPDFECLVIDDGNSEPDVLRTSDARVRVIRRARNGGPAAARNTGLDAARGSYVTFLDDDDLYTPERLALGLEGMKRAPVAVCWTRYVGDGAGRGIDRRLEGDVTETILDGPTIPLGAVTVARAAALRFDESFDNAEDVDWWLRTARAHPMTTVPRVGFLFRHHDTPRHRTDAANRLADNLALLEHEAGYFDRHPRAAARRWFRVGVLAAKVGDRPLARTALVRSLRRRPSPEALAQLLRSFAPGHRR
jgi:glycosyltransferase involved in cell wall biosynthesis